MADIVDRATRSRMMSAIGGKDTQPELLVRSMLHRAGLRFRVNVATLPGRPDIVLPRWRAVVFVHGCFWHRHPGCALAAIPKSRRSFWKAKFRSNTLRDQRVSEELRVLSYKVYVVWACEIEPRRIKQLISSIRGRRR